MRTLLIGLGAAAALWLGLVGVLIALGRRTAARELTKLIPNLLTLFRGLIGDARVPRRAKVLLGFGALWIASPIDLIPEFIPLLGPLDDAVVAALVLRYVLSHAEANVVSEHWRGDPATLDRLLRLFALPRAQPDQGTGGAGREA